MNVEDATNYLSEDSTHYTYTFGGSLPANNPTYVKRKADEQLYQKLKNGEFCYVLNSRQMGKSSLRVRTMQRLIREGVDCVEIDLTQIGNSLSKNEWYASIAFLIVMSFQSLSLDEFNDWWEKRKELSPLQNLTDLFSHFILKSTPHPIVIFVDEIDNVIDLDFSLDDFFAFIRYCYNHRVDNPDYNRLTFCLLGVATPSELIQKKHITPFNIGTGVELTGFTPKEAIPILSPGLASVVDNPEQVLTEVLHWTGGQPFLTQKLCRLIVENSALNSSNGKGSEEFASFVRAKIIENWENTDQPEHLKTIRDRVIKRSEQRASYLLELYQKIWHEGEVTTQSTSEEAELQLSGLVVNRQGKLRVYNPIYREVFNDKWVEAELASLRPYSETFKAWRDSGCQDESRLLRGEALKEAENWAKDKEIGTLDQEFLQASQAKQENHKIKQQNQKIKTRFLASLTLVSVAVSITLAVFSAKLVRLKQETDRLEELSELASELQKEGESEDAHQIWWHTGFSNDIQDVKLRRIFRQTIMAWGNLQMAEEQKDGTEDQENYLRKAEKELKAIESKLEEIDSNSSFDAIQIYIYALMTGGDFIKFKLDKNKEENENYLGDKALEKYEKAIDKIQILSQQLVDNKNDTKVLVLSPETIRILHRKTQDLAANQPNSDNHLRKNHEQIQHYLVEFSFAYFEYLLKAKKWKQADIQNAWTMLIVAERDKQEHYDDEGDIQNFSCPDLRRLDNLWYEYSNGVYGFRRQKEIYLQTGNKLDGSFSEEAYHKYLVKLKWIWGREEEGEVIMRSYEELEWDVAPSTHGHLPFSGGVQTVTFWNAEIGHPYFNIRWEVMYSSSFGSWSSWDKRALLASEMRTVTCGI